MEKCLSEKGKPLIIINSFKFRFACKCISTNEDMWRCTVKNCNARVYTVDNGSILSRESGGHKHEPLEKSLLMREQIRNSVKRKAVENIEERPAKLINCEIKNNKEALNTLTKTDISYIKNSMRKARLRKHPKLPKSMGEVDNKDGQAPLKQDGAPSTSTSTSQFPIPDFSASTSITQFGSPEASTSITQFGPPEASISKSNAEFISQEPSTSTSGTQFSPPENPPLHVPELFESHMYVSPTPMSFPEEMSARQNVDAIGIETQTSNLCPPDPIPTPTECTNTVKVKPIDTLQSKKTNQGISEPASKENKAANVDISVKTLESAIQRLESVSNKLAAVSLFDSYDQFGKYISSVLRGLPIRKVHSLKQKIITDVMQALTNDETLLAKNTSSQDRGPDVGQTHGKFSSEQSQQMRQLLDPKSFGGRIPVGGSIPVVYAKTLPPNTSTISQASQTTLAANIASNVNVSSGDNLQIADIGFISSIAPNTEMCKPYASAPTLSSRGRGRKRSGAPVTYTNKKKASQETSGGVMSVNPSGDGLSWDQQPTDSQQVTNLEDRLQDSKDSNEGGFTNDLEMNCEQEFDIDIEEGKELAQFKEDQQDSFETVLCGEGSEYFIKEEPPECELTAAAVTSASALTPDASTATCHVCSERCTSREQLLTHFRTAHPGTVAATSAQTSASTTTCWMCSKTCGSREDLLTHFRTAHPGPGATSSQASKTTCWVCNKTWSSKEDFFTHFRTEHPEYAVPGAATSASALTPDASAATCHVCSERCSSREELLTHFRTAHPGVGYMGT